MSALPSIDWRAFDRYSEQEIECRDGTIYRSHAKLVSVDGTLTMATEKPCPKCGLDHGHVRRASSDVERVTIG